MYQDTYQKASQFVQALRKTNPGLPEPTWDVVPGSNPNSRSWYATFPFQGAGEVRLTVTADDVVVTTNIDGDTQTSGSFALSSPTAVEDAWSFMFLLLEQYWASHKDHIQSLFGQVATGQAVGRLFGLDVEFSVRGGSDLGTHEYRVDGKPLSEIWGEPTPPRHDDLVFVFSDDEIVLARLRKISRNLPNEFSIHSYGDASLTNGKLGLPAEDPMEVFGVKGHICRVTKPTVLAVEAALRAKGEAEKAAEADTSVKETFQSALQAVLEHNTEKMEESTNRHVKRLTETLDGYMQRLAVSENAGTHI